MCTSLAMNMGDFFFGRNMDIEYEFGERVVITPRNLPLAFRRTGRLERHYAMIGMASVEDGYPLYAEAVNEKGLCMAGLNFPQNAYYPETEEAGRENVSPFELIPWVLGRCSTLDEAKKLLDRTHLTALPFSERLPLAPLHWHIADKESSIIMEPVREGVKIYENPVGVLTNNPTFDFQLMNLNQYLNLTAEYPADRFEPSGRLRPFGQGMGSIGLPGDPSPVSRFVRAAFYRSNSVCGDSGEKYGSEEGCVSQFFHILDSVQMVSGSVITPTGLLDKTTYSCCMNASKGIYYYKTYENNRITAVSMTQRDMERCRLREFALRRKQDFAWENK